MEDPLSVKKRCSMDHSSYEGRLRWFGWFSRFVGCCWKNEVWKGGGLVNMGDGNEVGENWIGVWGSRK